MSRIGRLLWNAFIGAVCCTSLPLSILAVGFTQRLMQRRIVREWHDAGSSAQDFETFAEAHADTRGQAQSPRWLLGPTPRARWRDRVGGLLANARLGFAVAVNTWVVTLPGCALWLFAWYDGWNNSFHKGYEQAAVGPLTGLFGVALFITAMLYVPLAQARQAATGEWRTFYQFGLVWRLARLRWAACVRLAGLYAVVSLPVIFLKTAPFVLDRFPGYASWTEAEVLALLENYYFFAGALVFGAFVWLRLHAARIYAGAVVEGVKRGALSEEELAPFERRVLDRLDLLDVTPRAPGPVLVRAISSVAGLGARVAAVSLAVLIWFAFVSQIFVSEFFNYHPGVGWLNQPLVQLPWFKYIPPGLD